ncbi:MAG TPA: hypothetical protein VHE54_12405 [Puia sp.]|nr:hypothetical protein [Puia sp.]
MKRQSAFLWVSFALLAALVGCSPSIQSGQMPSSALVKVECQNGSVRQILELLRSGRGKDISTVAVDGYCTEVTAAFSPMDTPAWKLEQVLEMLNGLGGVLHVELVENPHPIRQAF